MSNQEQAGFRGITVLGMIVNREEEQTVKRNAGASAMSVSDYLRDKEGFPKRGKRGRKQ